jgi:hypothetical protein
LPPWRLLTGGTSCGLALKLELLHDLALEDMALELIHKLALELELFQLLVDMDWRREQWA